MTRAYLRDPLGVMRAAYETCGPVASMNLFGMKAIVLLGAEANREVLLNRSGAFSSELGWVPVVGSTFPHGLISMDGEQHRDDRRMIGAAFKPEPMEHYLDAMRTGIRADLARWPEALDFYPAIKNLTLALAARTLLGLPLDNQIDQVSRAFVTMLGASAAFIRRPVPGGALWRGIRGRERLSHILRSEVPKRRDRPGNDLFSAICNIRSDEGAFLADDAIVNHVNLLLMAAHDTTTSALTSMVYMLAIHPHWQEEVRGELGGWAGRRGIGSETLRGLTVTDMVLNETLRCFPPVPSLPRGLTRDLEFEGHLIPAGSAVGIHILHTHYMAEHFPDPERFDPRRFAPEATRERHKYAWLPFGGGPHMCLGLHFASMQVKLFLAELLSRRRISLASESPPTMQWLPITRPRGGLPVRLSAA